MPRFNLARGMILAMPTAAPSTPTNAGTPGSPRVAPRRRWPKRIALAAGVWLLLLIVARLIWGWEADRRMRAKIAAYRAAGQPVLKSDFERPAIPDDENAAVLYKQAIQKIGSVAPIQVTAADGSQVGLTLVDLVSCPEWLGRYPDELPRLFEANAEALRLARAARDRPRCDWNLPLQSPLAAGITWLREHRVLAKTLAGAALCQHAQSDCADVVELWRDALGHADRMYDARGFLILYLVVQACEALTLEQMQRLLADLAIAAEPAATNLRQPAQPAQLRALLSRLLDESSEVAAWDAAWLGERLFYVDVWESDFAPAPSGPWPVRPLASVHVTALRPWWTLKLVRAMDGFSQLRQAGQAPNWPQAVGLAPALDPEPPLAEALLDPMEIALPGWKIESNLRARYWGLARRRMAATALAIRLFQVDHGRRPATLAELVPTYLPAVPVDPFAADSQALRYLPDDERPRLYSVGPNGEDDGGFMVWYRGRYGGVNWDRTDLAFTLDGKDPPKREADEDPRDN